MVEYAAKDTSVLIGLKDTIVSELEALSMGKVVDLEARFTPAMAYCADNGFAVDTEGWMEHTEAAEKALKEAKEACDSLAPERPEGTPEWAWNGSSHRKVGKALELLGAKVEKRASSGNYITDEVALKAIKEPKKARDLAQAILRYREHDKYVTTYGKSWFREPEVVKKGKTAGKVKNGSPDHLQVVDGRAYTKLNQLVVTGRGSSKMPNFQNLPESLRKYFVAPPGRKLITADYSQMEYLAAAYLAKDEALLGPIRERKDYHDLTADLIDVDRTTAKTINFAVLFGMAAKTLADMLGVPKKKAEEYMHKMFSGAPDLAEWRQGQIDKADAGVPYEKTPLGRIRLIDQNYRKYEGVWKSNRSQMLNQPIQGGCADGYKLAAALIWERIDEFSGNPKLVNMIHDEHVLEVDEEAAEADEKLLAEIMVEGMRIAFGEDIPARADTKISGRWEK